MHEQGSFFSKTYGVTCCKLFKRIYDDDECVITFDSGQPMKTDLRLEDGRIGEQPEVIYHVFHTLLFGGLAMVFEGYAYQYS